MFLLRSLQSLLLGLAEEGVNLGELALEQEVRDDNRDGAEDKVGEELGDLGAVDAIVLLSSHHHDGTADGGGLVGVAAVEVKLLADVVRVGLDGGVVAGGGAVAALGGGDDGGAELGGGEGVGEGDVLTGGELLGGLAGGLVAMGVGVGEDDVVRGLVANVAGGDADGHGGADDDLAGGDGLGDDNVRVGALLIRGAPRHGGEEEGGENGGAHNCR